jgi:hypothetical protein
MITDTINKLNNCKKLPKHPYMCIYKGKHELLKTLKRILRKFKIID